MSATLVSISRERLMARWLCGKNLKTPIIDPLAHLSIGVQEKALRNDGFATDRGVWRTVITS
jgi:hypothetical protein